MTYEEALEYIASLQSRGWRLGLERIREFCEKADLTPWLGGNDRTQYVHVAGTNGKGSTTAYLQSLLVEMGFRTGSFFSPFVVDPRERWQFGREMIAPDDLASIVEHLIPIAEPFVESELGGITEFEFKTAVAFEMARRQNCEWFAMEVGLGGRFDSTNVITPRASIIVSIGLDHVSILGDTIEAIAMEKAGIIKPGVPAVIGDLAPSALEVIQGIARERGSEVWRWGRDVSWADDEVVQTPLSRFDGIKTGIAGYMQGHNLALAVASLEAAGLRPTEEQVRRGAALAYVPGRFQIIHSLGTRFLLDGAHNTAAAQVLGKSLRSFEFSSIVLLTNMVQGHSLGAFYEELVGKVSEAFVVPIDFHRAYSVKETVDELRCADVDATPFPDLWSGIEAAAASAGSDGIVLVTGSFYLVGEVVRALSRI